LTNDQVISMAAAGLDEANIVDTIQARQGGELRPERCRGKVDLSKNKVTGPRHCGDEGACARTCDASRNDRFRQERQLDQFSGREVNWWYSGPAVECCNTVVGVNSYSSSVSYVQGETCNSSGSPDGDRRNS
jgi:hypothetical protein